MPLRLLEIYLDPGHADTLQAVAEQHGATDVFAGAIEQIEGSDTPRQTVRILVSPGKQQAVLDAVQQTLSGSEGWRIVVLPVEAALPLPDEREEDRPKLPSGKTASREEIYEDVRAGTRLDRNFIVLTMLSTIVAAIGLLTNNVAVVIGAMVIAPLLGPNLAFAFATAIADRKLMSLSLRTNGVGVTLSLLLSVMIGIFQPIGLDSAEVLDRTQVGYGGMALALASGAAAVLSVTTGLSSALVGVMVAVALLPPATAFGMLLGAGRWHEALGALLLLLVNVVCVNLAAQLVFLIKGLAPRTFIEKRESRLMVWRNIGIWMLLLIALGVVIYWRGGERAFVL